MARRGTPATNIRLTEEDKAIVEEIRKRNGLPSAAAAIRLAIQIADQVMKAESSAVSKVAKARIKNIPK